MEPTENKPPAGGKEKKTRRRLRLSCVECTKRRQKCDRTYPCSLCVTRGVAHLCRWETVPLARPPPARPPTTAPYTQSQDAIIQELSARIASLEKALAEQKKQNGQQSSSLASTPREVLMCSPSTSTVSVPSSDTLSSSSERTPDVSNGTPLPFDAAPSDDGLNSPFAPLYCIGQTVYSTTSTLARLSLGHHGEYIGRGSLICALHSMSVGQTPRFLYAKSTDATGAYRDYVADFSMESLEDRVKQLILMLPPVQATLALAQSFFRENNWRFGIPEEWFLTACAQMWRALDFPEARAARINANWLCLFFSVLAFAPPPATSGNSPPLAQEYVPKSSDEYFMCAMTARRIAEDEYLNKPNLSLMVSAADGTVLGCLAVPLLCSYLSERGRVSEAWKLVGTGLRNAEAVGMHRDPEWRQWQVMSKDEVLLRRRAWWGLIIWDKMYSYLLGRPQMVCKYNFDVALPSPIDSNGARSLFDLGRIVFIQLTTIAGETLERCFSVEFPNCPTFFEMDSKLKQWEDSLPVEYQQDRKDSDLSGISSTDRLTINHQRYTLLTWYLICRVKLYVAAITGHCRPPQSLTDLMEGRKQCVLLSMRLIRFQCDTHDAAMQQKAKPAEHGYAPSSNWYFEGCFMLFEASVVLLTTLTRFPWKEKVSEAEQLIDRAVAVFNRVIVDEPGKHAEIARMASEVLGTLRQEHWWKSQVSGDVDMTAPALPVPSPFAPQIVQPDVKPPDADQQWYTTPSYSSIFGAFTHHNPSVLVQSTDSNERTFTQTTVFPGVGRAAGF